MKPKPEPSAELKKEIEKCFRDTYMQTEGNTELFDIDETITAIANLIDKQNKLAVIKKLEDIEADATSTVNFELVAHAPGVIINPPEIKWLIFKKHLAELKKGNQ